MEERTVIAMKAFLTIGAIIIILLSIKRIFFNKKIKYYLHSEKKNGKQRKS